MALFGEARPVSPGVRWERMVSLLTRSPDTAPGISSLTRQVTISRLRHQLQDTVTLVSSSLRIFSSTFKL